AVVVGASLGGLCAARVLADSFERVTLVERDAVPRGACDRPGVPQARHVHALLARGMEELERLFRGFRKDMLEQGAVASDMGLDAAVMRAYGWAPRQRFGIDLLLASRRLIEHVVREKCFALPNVEVLEGTTVTGLRTTRQGSRLRAAGVEIDGRSIGAELVVDASGRTSRAPEWLRKAGLEPPEETVVDGLAGYSTRWYEAPERLPENWWWKSILIEPRPPENMYGAVLVPVEGRQWIVTLAGLSRRYPPTDEAGFTAALRWLRSPLIAEAVALAKPASPVYGSRAMSNRLRHYERWRNRLDGFVAVADSVCVFNPIYGQGMTTSAICARVLAEAIRDTAPTDPALAATFFRMQARAQQDPWALATGADLRLPDTEGPRPFGASLVGRYMESLFLSTREDPVVHRLLFEVLQMLRPVSALLAPGIAARVAARSLRRRIGGEGAIAGPVPASPPMQAPL
ncbi:MAG: NAD(P)/FAD-dependent oxidoreductase, partial [Candidatus Binatia bacterium]